VATGVVNRHIQAYNAGYTAALQYLTNKKFISRWDSERELLILTSTISYNRTHTTKYNDFGTNRKHM